MLAFFPKFSCFILDIACIMVDQFIDYSNDCINPVGYSKLLFKDEEKGNEKILEVRYILDKDSHFVSISFLLTYLYKFSVNEKLKLEIYIHKNFSSSLRRLIMDGKDIEKQHALQLLAQLTFNLEVNAKILKDFGNFKGSM